MLPAKIFFGMGLMEQVEAGLVALGCPKLNLHIRLDSPAVLDFYEKLGYAVEEHVSMGKKLPAQP